jgi:hypothetical protein
MKASGALTSLVHGVSTQNPNERLDGQVWTMSNIIPDPTEGAVKRPAVKLVNAMFESLPVVPTGASLDYITLNTESSEYGIGWYAGRLLVHNLRTGLKVPVKQDPASYTYFQSGVKSGVAIGEYSLLVGDATVQATQQNLTGIYGTAYVSNAYTTTAVVNQVCIIDIRQGAYSGKYNIYRQDQSILAATFTVPDGSSPSHSVQVQPEYIANQLYQQLLANSLNLTYGVGTLRCVQQFGSSIAMFFSGAVLGSPVQVFTNDGMYNTRMILTTNFVPSQVNLPVLGVHGHVVEVGKVRGALGNSYFRFEHSQGAAYSTAPAIDNNKLRTGSWVETSQSYPSVGLADGGVLSESTLPRLFLIYQGTAYIGSGAYIASQVLADTAINITPLTWGRRSVGNALNSPDPVFVGSKITWLGLMQDRLVIISERGVSMSRTSDYLEFYKESFIDDLDTDPIDLTSSYSANDTLLGAATLDRNLVVLGTKTHYTISGRAALTPKTAALLVTSTYESNPIVHPISFGNQVYFSSTSGVNTDILAIQPSDTLDSTFAYSVSSHVDGYIPSDVHTLYASTKLNILFALTKSGKLFCYRTLFNGSERVLSSWFDFTFPTDLTLKCLALTSTKLRLLFSKVVGTSYYTVIGELDLDRVGYTGSTGHKYLDFWQSVVSYSDGTYADAGVYANAINVDKIEIESNSSRFSSNVDAITGTQASTNRVISFTGLSPTSTYSMGVPYEVEFTPTLPLPKNRDGAVDTVSKLVVGQMKVVYTVGASFDVHVTDKYRDVLYSHNARRVSAADSVVGTAYITSGAFMFPVGSAESETRVSIKSYDNYPLVISSISWTGQFFKRSVSL